MDITGLYNNGFDAQKSAGADKVKKQIGNMPETPTEEELMDSIKTFESYFMEKILKEMKETFTKFGDDEEKSSMDQLSDMYMDKVYGQLAESVVDDQGNSLTQMLYEQMKRNYNID